MYLLYKILGISAIIGAAVCVLTMIPLQFLIGKTMSINAKSASVSTKRGFYISIGVFFNWSLILRRSLTYVVWVELIVWCWGLFNLTLICCDWGINQWHFLCRPVCLLLYLLNHVYLLQCYVDLSWRHSLFGV